MEGSEPDVTNFNLRPLYSSLDRNDEDRDRILPHYDMTGVKTVIVFNHYKYHNKKPKTRIGTHKDVKKIQTIFGDLGFDVIPYNDLPYSEIMEIINQVSQKDHTHTSCLIIVILTHGGVGGQLHAYDRTYRLNEIITKLENGHISLETVPKLIIIQACRGKSFDDGRLIEYDGEVSSPSYSMLTHINFLIMQSSVEDYTSWKGPDDGSWLIQELCEIIQEYHASLDILEMIVQTTKNIAFKKESITNEARSNRKKQTPETRFTLTKILRV